MFSVMAMDIDRTRQFVKCFGDRRDGLGGYTVVSMGDVDIAHRKLFGQVQIGLCTIDTDDGLHPEIAKFSEGRWAFGKPSGDHTAANLNRIG